MKPTRYASCNYKRLLPLIEGMSFDDSHRRFTAPGYMPLVVEQLYIDDKGRTVFSVAHYGEQNGDLMRDPDMEIAVDHAGRTVEPLTFRNDYLQRFETVYKRDAAGRLLYSPRLRSDLDDFLRQWLKNIDEQGFLDQPASA